MDSLTTLNSKAEPEIRFRPILFYSLSSFVEPSESLLGHVISLIGRFEEPFDRFGIVLQYALAVLIVIADMILRLDVALIRGHAIPLCRLRVVLRHAQSLFIHFAKLHLCIHVSPFGQRRKNLLSGLIVMVVNGCLSVIDLVRTSQGR